MMRDMRKISEIKHELGNKIAEYKALRAEGKHDEAVAKAAEVKALTQELEEAQDIERAEKAAAEERMGEQERKEVGGFSFRKFIVEAAEGKLTGLEREMSEEGSQEARNLGRTLKGLGIPYRVLAAKRAAAGQSAGTDADGGYLKETHGPSYIEALRAKLVMRRLGARFMSGLVGTVSFVKNSKADVAWLGEAATTDNEKLAFTLSEMKQRRLVVTLAYTKDLLNQTSKDVENIILNEMILAHAQGLDSAAINGDGTNAPKGILNLDDIGSVAIDTNGGAISWAKVVELETAVSAADAAMGRLSYLTNPKVVGALKTTERATGTARFLYEPGAGLNGYPVESTTLMPSDLKKGTGTNLSAMLFGNFQEVIIGQWGGLDIVVDPYTLKKSAQVEVTLNAWHDVFVRHEESFAAVKDILTA